MNKLYNVFCDFVKINGFTITGVEFDDDCVVVSFTNENGVECELYIEDGKFGLSDLHALNTCEEKCCEECLDDEDDLEEFWEEGYREGYKEGFDDAEYMYKYKKEGGYNGRFCKG